jgi:restriction system protein
VVPFICIVGATAFANRRSDHESLASTISLLSWRQFESAVGEGFRRHGFTVSELGTPTAERGVDLVLTRGSERYFVQCRQWRAEPVSLASVCRLHSAMVAEGATGGFVVTAGEFAKDARRFARRSGIELIDERGIDALLGTAAPTSRA